jgi:S-layer homology domain
LRNQGETGVTLSGSVDLLGRHNEVIGTAVIPPTFVGAEDTVFVDGQVCPSRNAHGPYKLKVRVHSEDPSCGVKQRIQRVREECEDAGDVSSSQWYYGYVTYLLNGGVVSGYADGTFRPNNSVTRGQVAKMVVLAFGFQLDTKAGRHFSDVSVGHPEYSYIETAYNRGIMSGYADGTFKPEANVTRGQVAKIIARAAGWAPVRSANPTFTDVPAGSIFYGYVEAAYAHGLLSGYADGTFRPGNNVTRAQMCKTLYGFVADSDPGLADGQ